jgi:RHS repeat-associated protein
MTLSRWFHALKKSLTASRTRRGRPRRDARRRPVVEQLEERAAPAVVTWTGAAGDGLWSTANNWSSGSVPGNGDDAVITGNVSVTHSSGSDTINTLTLGTGATLQITGASTINLQGAVGPQVTNDGTIDIGSSDGSTSGLLLFSSTPSSISGTGTINLENNGANVLEPNSADTLTIGSGQTVDAVNGQIGYSGGILINQATITTSAASGATVVVNLGGSGGSGSNSGTISATSGNLTVFGAFTNTGTISITGGGTLTLGDGSTDAWTNTGIISTTSSTVLLAGAITQAGIGTLNRDSGSSIYLTGSLTGGLSLSTATGSWYLDGGTLSGALTASGGSVLYGTAGGGTLNDVSLDATDALDLQTVNSATVHVTNNLTLASTTLNVGNSGGTTYGQMYFDSLTDNLNGTGTINLGSSSSNVLEAGSGDTLTIASGISINATGGTIGYFPGVLKNQGTITTSAASGVTVTVYLGGNDGSGSNSGTIQATSGNLLVYGAFSNTSTISIAGGGTLTVGGGGFAWTNTGTISTTSSTVDLAGAITQAGIGTLNRDSGSTINLTGTLTGGLTLNSTTGSWYLLGGTLSGALTASGGAVLYGTPSSGTLNGVSLDNTNALDLQTVNGAVVHVTNDLTLASTTLTLGNSGGSTYGQLYFDDVSAKLLGTGTIVLGSSGTNLLESIQSGANLTIPAGISIDAAAGAIGSPSALLKNHGTITGSAASGTTVTVYLGGPSTSGTNSGTIKDTGGDLQVYGSFTNTGTISITGGGTLTVGDHAGDAWTNTGTISTTLSTVKLDGNITQAGIGTLNHDISSTIDLAAQVTGGLTLSAATGSWYFDGGTLVGALTATGGSVLYGTPNGGTLNGVSLDNTNALDLQTVNGAVVHVTNDLTLSNTTLTLGNSSGSIYGVVYFNDAAAKLKGTGTIILGGSGNNLLETIQSDASLTIPAGITIDAAGGQIGSPVGTMTNQGTITGTAASGTTVYVYLGGFSVSGTNSGTIQDTSGDLQVYGGFTNTGTISISGGGTLTVSDNNGDAWSNTGTISTTNSTVKLDGSFTQAELGTLNRDAGSTIDLIGLLTGGLSLNATTGSWQILSGHLSGALTGSGGSVLTVAGAGYFDNLSLDSSNALDMQSVNGAYVYVVNDLTLNGTTLQIGSSDGTNAAALLFDSTTDNLKGTGTVVMNKNVNNQLYAASGCTLTVASGVSIDAAAGRIGCDMGVIDNKGTITATAASGTAVIVDLGSSDGSGTNDGTITATSGDLTVGGPFANNGTISISGGGTLTVGSSGYAWTNTGTSATISATGSTVHLDGSITQADVGTFNHDAASTIDVTGKFTGGLTLSAATGSWYLLGGTISGALTASGGSVLYGTASGGTLDGVSLDASNALDLQTVNNASVYVTNDLTLSGTTVTIGNSAGTTYGQMIFTSTTNSLLGTGTIDLGSNANNQLAAGANDSLTIPAGIAVNAAGGDIGALYGSENAVLTNQGTITVNPAAGSRVQLALGGSAGTGTNSGTIQASGGGQLQVEGAFTNTGTISIDGGGDLDLGDNSFNWTNTGTISTTNSTVHLQGAITQANIGTLNRDSGSTIDLSGTLSGGLTLDATTGSWNLFYGTLSGGTLTASGGSHLVATKYAGTLDGVSLDNTNALDMTGDFDATVYVTNDLTLSGTTIDLGNSGGNTQGFLVFTCSTDHLKGTGTINLSSNTTNAVYAQGGDTLSIGSGITINAIGGMIGGVFSNAGNINILGGGTVTLGSNSDPWTNTGTIAVTGSTVNLGGAFTQAGLGKFSRDTASTVNLSGTLTGGLALDATTGSWNLAGGTLAGALTGSGGSVLYATGNSGFLNSVSLDATNAFDLQTSSGATAYVVGGLTLAGTTLTIGAANGSTYATLLFADPTNTLLGSGTVNLGSDGNNALEPVSGSTLTLAAGIRVNATGGSVGCTVGVLNNQGTITASAAAGTAVNVNLGGFSGTGTNSGTIAATSGDLNVTGAFTNTGKISLAGGGTLSVGTDGYTWSNVGTIFVDDPGSGVFYGTVKEVNNGTLTAGTWEAVGGATVTFPTGTTITTNAATLVLSGVGAKFTGLGSLGANSGSLTVTGGATLTTGANFTNQGALTIGPDSTVTAPGKATQTALGTLNLQIGGTPQSGQFGQIVTGGQLTAGGTVSVSIVNGVGVTQGDAFQVLTFGSLGGTFLTFNGLAPIFTTVTSPTRLFLTAVASSLDLVPTQVTAPTSASPGQTVTVTWHVMNQSGPPATGAWQDSVYLSVTPRITAHSILLGSQTETGGPNTGVQYDGSRTVPLPAIAPGNYYVLLQVDSLNQTPDQNRTNNMLAAAGQLTVGLPGLTLGTPLTDAFTAADQDHYYQVTVPAGGTLTFALQSTASDGATALYVSRGILPTLHNFQFAAVANQQNQTITVPQVLTAGTYYVLAHSVSGSAATAGYTLTATQTSALTITDTSSYAGGQGGKVTIEIDGTNFAPSVTASLTGTTTLLATAIDYVNASQIFATFDLSGAAQGSYTVGVQQGTQTATTVRPFQVLPASPTALNVVLITPQFVHTGRTGTVTLTYTNTTNNDIAAPLLNFSSTNTAVSFSTPDNPNNYTQSAQVLAVAAQGPAGILRPGQSGVITLTLLSNDSIAGDQIPVQVTQVQAGQTIDWAAREASLKPATFSAAAWDVVFHNLLNVIGTTSDSYNAALAHTATYLGGLGETAAQVGDVSRLFSFLVAQANAAFPTATLATAVDAPLATPGKLPLGIDRTFVSSIAGRYQPGIFGLGWTTSWQTSLSVDGVGNVTIGLGGTLRYFVAQPDGTFLDTAGETGTLTLTGGVYTYTTATGLQYVFLPDGQLNYMQDTNGNRLTLGYNTGGQLVSVTYSNPSVPSQPTEQLTLSYNGQGLVAQASDGVGNTYVYSYDAAGHLLSVEGPGGLTTTYTYDTGNNPATLNALLSITNPDGSQKNFTYDSQGRLSGTSQNGGTVPITYTYGGQGQVTATDAAGNATTVWYNELGLPSRVQDPRGGIANYAYDANGNLVTYTDAAGNPYQYTYDQSGNLTQITNPLGQSVQLTYGPLNNLTSLTDQAGNTIQYKSDPSGNLLSITYPGGDVQQFQYDPLGNQLSTIEQNGDVVGYQYNAEGQVTKKSFTDGTSQTFTYDAHGDLLTAQTFDSTGNLTGTTTLTYNAAGQLTSVAYPDGRSLTFTYNAQGQRTQSVDQSGFTINYTYDTLSRLTKLTDGSDHLIVQYKYNSVGLLQEKDNANGTYTTYAYDAAGNLVSEINYAGGTTVNSSFIYTYNALGQVTSVTDSANHTTTYTYDALGQLTQVTLPGGPTITYSYNADGVRTAVVTGNTTTTYSSNTDNEVTQVGSTTYTYDPNGNLQTVSNAGGTTTYAYNDLNQLVSITAADKTVTSFQYSALGFLTGTNAGGTQTNYLVDPTGPGNVAAAYDGNGKLIAHYLFGLGLVSQTGPGGTGFYDFNGSGNTVGITGSNGSYVNQYSYLPFGETTTVSAALPNPFTFAGQVGVLQIGANLFAVRTRDYAAVLGQFLSNDPLGLGGNDPNLRRYVGNDPITLLDVTGLAAQAVNAVLQAYAALVSQLYQQYSGAANSAVSPLPSQSYYTGPLFTVGSTGGGSPQEAKPADRRAHASGTAGSGSAAAGAGAQLPTGLGATQTARGSSTNQTAPSPTTLLGPAGVGQRNYIQPTGNWSYTADFKNSGTGPVQMVTLSEQLDANLDWSHFQLGSFGFGPVNVVIPAGLTDYQTMVVYQNSDGTPLDVSATFHFNVQTGLLTASFLSLDPDTGLAPMGLLDGFLPPDNSQGVGKAFVQYTVPPRASLPTFTAIHQQAAIVFDGNAVQNTNPVAHTINAGFPATHLVVTAPVQALPGGKFSVTVNAEGANNQIDALYQGSVALSLSGSSGGGKLNGVLIAPIHDGVATFTNLSLSAVGSFTLLAASTGNLMPMTATVNVVPAPVFHVTLTPVTSGQTGAGQQFTAKVTALLGGNPDTGYVGTVQLSSNDPHAAGLPGSYTFLGTDGGTRSFTVTLETAGTRTVTAIDASLASVHATSSGIGVTPVAVSQFGITPVSQQPPVIGSPYAVIVTAEDQYGNKVPTYTGTVHFSSTSGTATLPKDFTFTATNHGSHGFTITPTSVGGLTLQVSDNNHSGSLPVTVVSAATQLLVSVGQTNPMAGTLLQVTVTAFTAAGKLDTNFHDTLHFAGAGVSLDEPFPAGTGSQTFSVTPTQAGTQRITVTDTSRPQIKGTSPSLTVGAASASKLRLSARSAPAVFGTADTITLTALDPYGNPAAGFGGLVQLSVSGGSATVPTSVTLTGPTGTFTLTPQSLGNLTLTATAGSLTTSLPLTVISAATHLGIPSLPTSITAGQPFTITVAALNAAGKPVSPFTDVLHFSDNLGNTGLPADAAFNGTNGQEQFTLTLPDAGKHTITITDVSQSRVRNVFLTGTVKPAGGTGPTAGVSGPTVGVPGQPLTFTLTAGGTGTVFTYHIDWAGNGSVLQAVTGANSLTVTHVYPKAGTFTPKVTAVDAAGDAGAPAAAQPVTITMTAVEADPLTGQPTALAVGLPVGGGTLTITPANADGTDIALKLGSAAPTLPAQPFSHLLVFGQGGTDMVQEPTAGQTTTVGVSVIVFGGTGTNVLSVANSRGGNVLIGSPGHSTLTGGNGADILIGGGGPAVLHAGGGGDILIAGSTVYDTNATALLLLLKEWDRMDITYPQRVADLFGTGSGGQNGAFVLTAQTVARDTAMSQLFGGAGMDWYWLNQSGKTPDQLNQYADGEIVSFE